MLKNSPAPFLKAFKIACIYTVVAALWIVFSDRFLLSFSPNIEVHTQLQTAKGWLFVFLSALLFFALTYRAFKDLKANQETLKHRERDYQLLVDSSAVALIGIDLEGRVTVWNPSAEKIFGWTENEVIGKILPIIPNDAREEFQKIIDTTSSDQKLSVKEVVRQKKDGTRVDVRLSTSAIHDENGTIVGIMAALEDVTEKRRTEKALKESDAKFRDMFHKHSSVKLLIDAKSGQIVDANVAAARFYGWTIETLKSKSIDSINTLTREEILKEMERAHTHKKIHFEFKHQLADGSQKDVAVFSSGLSIDGKDYLYSIIHDISAHKSLEAQLIQAQKMESIGRLAGGVAHDINNMLGVVMGYASVGMAKLERTDPIYAMLREINNAGQRSAEITKQLLAFARKQAIVPKVLELNDVMEGMLSMLRRLLGENIDLAWQPGTDLGPVMIDPAQLDQILMNLCVNARDAIDSVGKLTIETGAVSFDKEYCAQHAGFVSGRFIMLAVSDNGCGMDSHTLNKVFEPFFSTKGIGEGTGLGLATVYGIVKQNNGFIHVYSEPGQGATFKIYLPEHDTDDEYDQSDTIADTPMGDEERILLVEDDFNVRTVTETMLNENNYRVIAAGTPQEALQLAAEQEEDVDLLLTDVVMPEMNGKQLAALMVETNPKLKVLYMSGYTANVMSHHGVFEEKDNFIQKPLTMGRLNTAVANILDKT